MGFVDGDKADLARRQELQKAVAAFADQTFGGNIEEAVAPLAETRADGGLLVGSERAVVKSGRHAVTDKRVDLVLHQRDKGRDDEGKSRAHDGRRLEAQRLAAAGRQNDQRVAANEDRVHRFPLQGSEGRVSPVARDRFLKRRHARLRPYRVLTRVKEVMRTL